MREIALDNGGVRPLPIADLPYYLAALTLDLVEQYKTIGASPRPQHVAAIMRRLRMLEHLTAHLNMT